MCEIYELELDYGLPKSKASIRPLDRLSHFSKHYREEEKQLRKRPQKGFFLGNGSSLGNAEDV